VPWFKIDDGFHGHPKVFELSLEAVGIWTLAGSWCAKYLTDGAVTGKAIARLGGSPALCAELVDAGLWLVIPDGFQFKDWDDYQPLKDDVEAEREAARERMKAVRAKKKGVSPDVQANVQANNTGTFEGTSEEVRVTPSHPIPSRPISNTPAPDGADEFDKWYALYPKKKAKGQARVAFKAARKKTSLEVLIAGVQRFAQENKGKDPQFLAYPATWLNGERWEDESSQAPVVVSGPWAKAFHERGQRNG
jgi:hypothetical protein